MALAFKERQEHLTQFVYAVRLGIHGFYLQKKMNFINYDAEYAKKKPPLNHRGDNKSRYHPNSS